MECISCKEQHTEVEWKSRPGEWVARNPDATKRGFHLNALASPWEKWSRIIEEFKSAKSKGTENLKTWVNTTLGESWEDKTNDQDHEKLISRRIRYNCEVPKEALVLTAGVDVQDDRLEVEVVGWGINDVSYGIDYKVFYGDPGQDAVWNQMDAFLMKDFIRNDGVMLNITAACVDSGGHYTNEVYDFCKAREHRRIFAIKGRGGAGVAYINKPNKVGRQSVHLFTIGVNEGKDIIYSRLKNEFEDKPGYCYFPVEKEKGYDEAYFVGLTAERKVTRFVGGAIKIDWVKRSSNIRNEPLDLRNYALAAFRILNPDMSYLAENNLTGNVFSQGTKGKKKGVVEFYRKVCELLGFYRRTM